jgi:hypothetical protein
MLSQKTSFLDSLNFMVAFSIKNLKLNYNINIIINTTKR